MRDPGRHIPIVQQNSTFLVELGRGLNRLGVFLFMKAHLVCPLLVPRCSALSREHTPMPRESLWGKAIRRCESPVLLGRGPELRASRFSAVVQRE